MLQSHREEIDDTALPSRFLGRRLSKTSHTRPHRPIDQVRSKRIASSLSRPATPGGQPRLAVQNPPRVDRRRGVAISLSRGAAGGASPESTVFTRARRGSCHQRRQVALGGQPRLAVQRHRPRKRDRGARIRTGDFLLPKQARYQAAPRPAERSLRFQRSSPCSDRRQAATRAPAPGARPTSRRADDRSRRA